MERIQIARTEDTPDIDFDFQANRYVIRGESNPEDVHEFYGEIMEALHGHLANLEAGEVTFEMELVYFNSTSAKVFFDLMGTLNTVAQRGVSVTINWIYDVEDDVIPERGEEFAEEFEAINFNMIEEEL